eukprot:1361650-Rhodomonas_salina.1
MRGGREIRRALAERYGWLWARRIRLEPRSSMIRRIQLEARRWAVEVWHTTTRDRARQIYSYGDPCSIIQP